MLVFSQKRFIIIRVFLKGLLNLQVSPGGNSNNTLSRCNIQDNLVHVAIKSAGRGDSGIDLYTLFFTTPTPLVYELAPFGC